MNCNNSKYDYIRKNSRTKQVRIAKGIKQEWYRRFYHHIHSGVRVKVQRKNSLFIEPIHQELKSSSCNQTNRIQSMVKRLRFESETTDNSSQNQSLISYPTKPIFNNSFLRENYLLRIQQKDKNVNSIGIQTIMITQIDQQTSCNLIKSIPMLIQNSRSSSSSLTSISETSTLNENSTHTDSSTSTETSTVSSTTADIHENDDHNARYQRNKNAIDTDIERKNNHINMKEFKMEKAITQLSNNEQLLQDNTQCYPQMTSMTVSSTGKKRFFDTFLNRIFLLRLSSFKRDRAFISTTTIRTPIVTDASRNERNKNLWLPTAHCRRSVARNFNHNSSIEPEKHYFQIRSEEDSPSKRNHLAPKASIHTVSNISISTRKQCRQANNSSLSIVDSHIDRQKNRSHRSNKKSSKTTGRKHSHRKNCTNRHYKLKYLHRKKRKHIHKSNRASQLKTFSIPPIVIQNQPLSSVDDQSNIHVGEYVKSSVYHTEYSNNEDKQDFSPPTDSICLRVKNKNLISNLSKSKILLSSIYPMNNNSIINTSALKITTEGISTSNKSNIEPIFYSIKESK